MPLPAPLPPPHANARLQGGERPRQPQRHTVGSPAPPPAGRCHACTTVVPAAPCTVCERAHHDPSQAAMQGPPTGALPGPHRSRGALEAGEAHRPTRPRRTFSGFSGRSGLPTTGVGSWTCRHSSGAGIVASGACWVASSAPGVGSTAGGVTGAGAGTVSSGGANRLAAAVWSGARCANAGAQQRRRVRVAGNFV
jgi:hypothetical protein